MALAVQYSVCVKTELNAITSPVPAPVPLDGKAPHVPQVGGCISRVALAAAQVQ